MAWAQKARASRTQSISECGLQCQWGGGRGKVPHGDIGPGPGSSPITVLGVRDMDSGGWAVLGSPSSHSARSVPDRCHPAQHSPHIELHWGAAAEPSQGG